MTQLVKRPRRYVVERDEYPSDAAFNAAKVGKLSRDATGRARAPSIILGDEEISGATGRDAVVVGRALIGETNCHGYADRTVISGVTDVGTYGSFDCTVELTGAHNQNHVYAYQDRVRYSGSGTLQYSAGFLSQTIHSGTGQVLNRNAIEIDPMAVTNGGTIAAQTGVRINHMSTAANNVGLFIGQTDAATGWAMYAPGGGKSYHAGQIGMGTEPDSGVRVHVAGNGRTVALRIDGSPGGYGIYAPTSGDKHYLRGPTSVGLDNNPGTVPLAITNPDDPLNRAAFISSDTARGVFGVLGDGKVAFVGNGQTKLICEDSAASNAIAPGVGDNVQDLGRAAVRFAVVRAGTGTISTSDAREKTDVRPMTAAEIAAAAELAGDVGIFQFLASVEAKGDAARLHVGMTVQHAVSVLARHGLDPTSYAWVCHDQWGAEVIEHAEIDEPAVVVDEWTGVLDSDGTPIKRQRVVKEARHVPAWTETVVEAGDRWGFRADQLALWIARGLHERLTRLERAA